MKQLDLYDVDLFKKNNKKYKEIERHILKNNIFFCTTVSASIYHWLHLPGTNFNKSRSGKWFSEFTYKDVKITDEDFTDIIEIFEKDNSYKFYIISYKKYYISIANQSSKKIERR